MSKVEIILSVTAIVSAVTAFKFYFKCKTLEYTNKIKVHKCLYNDNPNCHQKACNYCGSIKECNFCCGSHCDTCPGHKVEYVEESEK
jgi:hypothetical protein